MRLEYREEGKSVAPMKALKKVVCQLKWKFGTASMKHRVSRHAETTTV